ncbi:NAD(P)-binding protein [Decorospora gaudefroyi]|uniref:NAD(P)-binding protein n=1 Tax=Decorospora gaudefroyi TaxID=184978 RepID=A0A6A5K2Z5_9PLEO|nr:NAD(P)-binding protein [Decorospora gaudefroyi]
MATRAVLVTGATGKQGSAVIDALLKANAPYEILALTRNAQSPSAQKLLKKSPTIKLLTGDLDACDQVFTNAKEATKLPIWGVFSVQFAMGKNEEPQGKALVDASLKHGVQHFVYSSVDRGGPNSDTNPTVVPHFITKHNIEQHLFAKAKGSNMTWTVLRPVAFSDNLTPDFMGKVFVTAWALKLKRDQKLQLIATSDIGFFAAQAFLLHDSDAYRNQSLSLAGDEISIEELRHIFERRTGLKLPATYRLLVQILCLIASELGSMYNWFRDVGFGVDIEEVRKIHPEVKSFERWLETESFFLKHRFP